MLIKVGIIGFVVHLVDVFLEMTMLHVFRPRFLCLNGRPGGTGRPKKILAGSPAAAEGLQLALTDDQVTPLNSIKHQSSGTAEVDPDYPGTAFKRYIPHGPPLEDWPVEDAFSRICALDAHKFAITYKSSFYNFINVMKDFQLHQMYVPAHFAAHLPKKKWSLSFAP